MGQLTADLDATALPELAEGEREALLLDATALLPAGPLGRWAARCEHRAERFAWLARDRRLLRLARDVLGEPVWPVGVGIGAAPLPSAPDLPDADLHLLVRLERGLPRVVRPLPQRAGELLTYLARGTFVVVSYRRLTLGEPALEPTPPGRLWAETAVCAG